MGSQALRLGLDWDPRTREPQRSFPRLSLTSPPSSARASVSHCAALFRRHLHGMLNRRVDTALARGAITGAARSTGGSSGSAAVGAAEAAAFAEWCGPWVPAHASRAVGDLAARRFAAAAAQKASLLSSPSTSPPPSSGGGHSSDGNNNEDGDNEDDDDDDNDDDDEEDIEAEKAQVEPRTVSTLPVVCWPGAFAGPGTRAGKRTHF